VFLNAIGKKKNVHKSFHRYRTDRWRRKPGFRHLKKQTLSSKKQKPSLHLIVYTNNNPRFSTKYAQTHANFYAHACEKSNFPLCHELLGGTFNQISRTIIAGCLISLDKTSALTFFHVLSRGVHYEYQTAVREQSAAACQVIQIGAYRRNSMLADQQLLRWKRARKPQWGDFNIFSFVKGRFPLFLKEIGF